MGMTSLLACPCSELLLVWRVFCSSEQSQCCLSAYASQTAREGSLILESALHRVLHNITDSEGGWELFTRLLGKARESSRALEMVADLGRCCTDSSCFRFGKSLWTLSGRSFLTHFWHLARKTYVPFESGCLSPL